MSYQKALCLICELPTADGAVLAVHVDKEKLQEWFLNVCGHELAEDVDDDDLICYFCVWHAEFLWKFNGMSLVWWPRNSDYLDDAAKELRMYYFEGKLEQCWVPLEKVKLPKDEEDIEDSNSEIQSTIEQAKKKCFYCAKPFKNRNISRHVKKTHKNAIRCSRGLVEMSLQKALCLICECPTADGAVLAVHVDKEKLQEWFLNVSGQELAEEVEDEDLICYFCLWHAEFQWKFSEIADENLVWWPRYSDYLDDAAKELRKNYFEGKLEQCWVQLEKIELPESDIEDDGRPTEAKKQSRLWNCFYCKLQFKYNYQLSKHMKEKHKEAIRLKRRFQDLNLKVIDASLLQSSAAVAKPPGSYHFVHSGSGSSTEMTFQKALCLICERPTVDHAIFAVHVDKDRLKNWFLNVSGYDLAEDVKDEDKICYFCAWQAEFLWKFNGMEDEDLIWWPRNLDYDDAAKELRKYYFEGKIEQCWVQLEEVDLTKSEEDEIEKDEEELESVKQSNIRSEKKKCFYCGSGGLADMSLQKVLCLICERPTADGAVLAVHVDKDKLQTWFLNVCGHELEEEIRDEDKICYFCLWHAEFQWKFDELADETLVWWNLDLDDAAKELRKYYSEGKVEQCWVQLEEIELPKSDDEEKTGTIKAKRKPRTWKCIYCGKRFKYSRTLSEHMKKMHKEAFRCENRNCATYFHSLEEKEEHTKNIHEKSKEREKFNCSFCGKEFEGPQNYNKHVRQVHKEFPVKCSLHGCLLFFQTKAEMKTHFDSVHGKDYEAKKFRCNDCDYKAMKKSHLELHIANKHLPKYMKCKICDIKLYSTESTLRTHVNQVHKFKVCTHCKLVVSIHIFQKHHLNITKCNRCKSKFQCSGLYQSHLKSCKKTIFKCD
ncbi:Hypothetical predicted protein [Cloeon dipterum]|uniref:C2H2-type domain-containing protein n=1 Tax=Cloeon dipterum TaxID=197152 RepID=A0A8S1E7D5_9INSE|nr:Hypothetical predicted protein [Cloeon dipterum]